MYQTVLWAPGTQQRILANKGPYGACILVGKTDKDQDSKICHVLVVEENTKQERRN